MSKNIQTLISLTKYTFLASLRNPSAVFFGFVFPFIFIIVFGLIGQGSTKFDLGIVQESEKSGPIYDALSKIDVINLVTDKDNATLNEQLNKGQIPALLRITAVNSQLNGPTVITYKLDLQTTSADPQNGSVIQNILSNLVNTINNPPSSNSYKFVELATTNVEGRKFKSIDFILPGQLDFSLLSTGIFGVAFSLLTLRKTLVLKRMYATPTPRWVILLSRVFSSIIMAVMQATLIILVGHFAFGFTLINGVVTFLQMIFLAIIGLLSFLGLGLVVTSLADSEDAIAPIANLVTLPQFLLSGAFFPIDSFPAFLKPIAQVMPMTFLNDAMRAVAFEGAGIEAVLPKLLGLLIWGIISYIIAIRIFKWE